MDWTQESALAYETAGTGTPVVLLHGLTFDKTTWRPIVEALHGDVHTIAFDLPSHGDSPGVLGSVEQLAARVHHQLGDLGVTRPLAVGHSFGAGLAGLYAARYPCLGVVTVDQGLELEPFAERVQRAAPMLRGPGFDQAWAMIEASLGLQIIPEPVQSLVRAAHQVDQAVVLDYWEQMLTTPPAQMQAHIDSISSRITVPVLAVFGHHATDGDRQRYQRLPQVQIEEHPGEGHFVHLVNPARFAASLRKFAAHCTTLASPRDRGQLHAHQPTNDRQTVSARCCCPR